MALYHLILLAVVQGITEFLPISSSGHLVITSQLLGLPDQGLILDIAVHVGTLFAVLIYFWRDIWEMTVGILRLATGRRTPGAALAGNVLIASLPVVAVGFLAHDLVAEALRSVAVIAWATIGFGVLLWLADRLGMTFRRIEHLRWGAAAFIGVAQCLALIPGTSRSGITMTAARMLSFERPEAARFSMLLSIPTIAGAGVLAGYDIYKLGNVQLGYDAALAAAVSFLVALLAIALLMRWLQRASFTPFAVYRVLLGLLLLYWVYG
ncbi:MAG: undecaprenyl-diphosphate phosphatase [Alphaproteobacteria bacterium]